MYASQRALELELSVAGRARAMRIMKANEEKGRASSNAYASPIYRRFVAPLAEEIEAALNSPLAGRKKAHVEYLRPTEPAVAAYIAVRGVLVNLLEGSRPNMGKELCSTIGGLVQAEQAIRQLEGIDPDRAFYLQQELRRRQSVSVRHRNTLVRMEIKELDGTPIDWGAGGRLQVGAWLIERLRGLGMLEMWHRKTKRGAKFYVETQARLTPEVMELIHEIKEVVAETMPYFTPCVEKPYDWVGVHDGGFHTPEMRHFTPTAIRGGNRAGGDPSLLLAAINVLQAVEWRVNTDILGTLKALSRAGVETEEIVSAEPPPQPGKPTFLSQGLKKDEMTEEQRSLFKAWRREMAEWHTQMKLKGQKYGRMYNALGVADKFKDHAKLWFVYGADFRGRFYPSTSGISPQGSDMQKALLMFSEGKPLADEDAVKWFMIHGANKFGVDKVPLPERVQWVMDNHEQIMRWADSPVEDRTWLQADKPFQFLAWAFEYARWNRDTNFRSHLPVGLDGSCNGLQNFSAMLRDQDGGQATNLLPSVRPRDIYTDVAELTSQKLKAMDDPMAAMWAAHGIGRKVVKRSVMTLPYGSTMHSCGDFILNDYLKAENIQDIPPEVHFKASRFLARVVWEAIGEVVVKAREAMDWLQVCSLRILDAGHREIQWDTPSGFVAQQDYMEWEKGGEIRIQLFGGAKWALYRGGDKPARREHRNGIAPNFVHSMDAAHMQEVAIRSAAEGIAAMAMIHDDFGTHAADTQRFSQIIRESFVEMYERNDPLAQFKARYEALGVELPAPPARGYLDIRCVLESPYFFA